MLYRKLSWDTKITLTGGKGLRIVGWITIVESLLAVLGSGSAEELAVMVTMGIMSIAIGIIFLVKGYALKREAKEYRKYLEPISQGMTDISNLAFYAQVDYQQAVNDIRQMIEKEYIIGARIDPVRNEIVYGSNIAANPGVSYVMSEAKPKVEVVCPGCGARNMVRSGEDTECEYCGTPISAK